MHNILNYMRRNALILIGVHMKGLTMINIREIVKYVCKQEWIQTEKYEIEELLNNKTLT